MNTKFKLENLIRTNVKTLNPYSSARDEFSGTSSIFLDANENPFDNGINRYPDPQQWALKKRLSEIKGLAKENMILGNGSDEIIDLLLRAFCEPSKDKVIICNPTYGMYQVAAQINDLKICDLKLDSNFQPDVKGILDNNDSKLLFLCSPNNPTGNLIEKKILTELLNRFKGLIVLDEAYIDFAADASMIKELYKYPNLIILQTLSKAWGMAGIRLGIGMASREIIEVLNKIKPPYNVNTLTQEKALELLGDEKRSQDEIKLLLKEKEWMLKELRRLSFVEKVFPSQANFILILVKDANALYQFLIEKGIVIRNRTTISQLQNCLRISIGTIIENQSLFMALKEFDKK
ncbi:histidinol-phosphate transaminase [Ancylomarina euxinus]|uniref:Histidinol-phosphate aminotransferase n=1 Tax=Ancylomarina euxinus TaxID=2283627 RepID=A0A425Y4I4_9BACT|nr:histidinol-phosphate transaminase [Ancylomarina euxinus]MCZ4694547.1 histidinol-phosphate transaminase [Ancylomarina euxinus]MUP14090.1 histidinol-phosphate transaminase [Ancylomarina euxinus]RRG22948.1 histidinol-phosphate transaminase [Ancylomarina euxinus]